MMGARPETNMFKTFQDFQDISRHFRTHYVEQEDVGNPWKSNRQKEPAKDRAQQTIGQTGVRNY